MPRPLRMFEPNGLQFITNRTLQATLLMTPLPVLREIIGSTLARAMRLYEIQLYGYVFLSTHFHLLLSGVPEHIPLFMQYLQSVLARRLNRVLARSGAFFERRYSAESVEDDDAAVARLKYILAHGVKEGLVGQCTEWPGLHASRQLLTGESETFDWVVNPAADDPEAAVAVETLTLAPLPCWQDVPAAERQRMVADMIAQIEQEATQERGGKPPLGVEAILKQNPLDRAATTARSCRPLCHASSKATYEAYRKRYREFCQAYAEASDQYRRGHWDASFPDYAFRPPLIVNPSVLEQLSLRVVAPTYRRRGDAARTGTPAAVAAAAV